MGGMMTAGGMGAWMILWVVLGLAVLAVAVAGGVLVARAVNAPRKPESPAISAADSAAARAAKNALKLRYAHGEISREEYLQGKVELDD